MGLREGSTSEWTESRSLFQLFGLQFEIRDLHSFEQRGAKSKVINPSALLSVHSARPPRRRRDVLKEVAHAVASPHLPKRLRRPSNDMTSALVAAASSTSAGSGGSGGGRLSRRGSVDQGPWMQVKEGPPEVREYRMALIFLSIKIDSKGRSHPLIGTKSNGDSVFHKSRPWMS